MFPDVTLFEQPANEHMRACLRLEYLFKQSEYCLKNTSAWDSRAALAAIIDIVNILDRPDLKVKLTKELNRFLILLERFEKTTHIDQNKLSGILVELEDLCDNLHATDGKIGKNLRQNEFLNNIRNRLTAPAGACDFDAPAFSLWLQLPHEQRQTDLTHWLSSFKTIQAATNLILRLTRECAAPQSKTAIEGFFQNPLDPQAPCQLLRVMVPTQLKVYPEISVGRYGICVRFFELAIDGERPTQTTKDIPFKLAACTL